MFTCLNDMENGHKSKKESLLTSVCRVHCHPGVQFYGGRPVPGWSGDYYPGGIDEPPGSFKQNRKGRKAATWDCHRSRPGVMQAAEIELKQSTPQNAVAIVLEGTKYVAQEHGQILNVMPLEETQIQKMLLGEKLGSFKPIPQTMYEIGALFEGWMEVATHPGQGWGSSILGTLDTHNLEFSAGDNDTVFEVLNSLVSQDSGGLWIMQPLQEAHGSVQAPKFLPFVQVSSYRDNNHYILAQNCH